MVECFWNPTLKELRYHEPEPSPPAEACGLCGHALHLPSGKVCGASVADGEHMRGVARAALTKKEPPR